MIKTYSIANDTQNGIVVNDKLAREIATDISILYALNGITVNGDDLVIEFRGAITAANWLAVDAFVTAHDGNPGLDDPQRFTLEGISSLVGAQGEQGVKGDKGDAGDGSLFGSEFKDAESYGESSTSSSSYINKVFLVTGDLPSGKYRIEWSASICSTDKSMELKAYEDGGDIIDEVEINDNYIKSKWKAYSGFRVMDLSGVHTFKVDYNGNGSGTAKIRHSRINIWRVL